MLLQLPGLLALGLRSPADDLANALQRFHHTLHLERLDHVVKRIDLERLRHIVVVCRRENKDGARVGILNRLGAFQPRHARHFHIQKADLRLIPLHQLEQIRPVVGLAAEGEAFRLFNHFAHNHAHTRLVVRNDDANRFAVHAHLPRFIRLTAARSPGRVKISLMMTPRSTSL